LGLRKSIPALPFIEQELTVSEPIRIIGGMMGIFASGMNSSWAFVVSAGKRYADEGYFEGTTYDGNSLF
jgi:hypothetical protein